MEIFLFFALGFIIHSFSSVNLLFFCIKTILSKINRCEAKHMPIGNNTPGTCDKQARMCYIAVCDLTLWNTFNITVLQPSKSPSWSCGSICSNSVAPELGNWRALPEHRSVQLAARYRLEQPLGKGLGSPLLPFKSTAVSYKGDTGRQALFHTTRLLKATQIPFMNNSPLCQNI